MTETDLILMLVVVFLPAACALGLLFFPKGWEEAMRWFTLFATALTLGISIAMFFLYKHDVVDNYSNLDRDASKRSISLAERARIADGAHDANKHPSSTDWLARVPWIERFGIDLYLGADGISMAMVLLTTALCFLAMIASWGIEKFVRGYLILFLVLETGMIGTFLALDFFLFYIFWEVMLLPMYFLIGVWGGPRREYAAIKFFLYTLFGSVFILIALLGFYFTDVRDFVGADRLAATVGPNASNKDLTDARKDFASAESALNKLDVEEKKAKEELTKAQEDLKAAAEDAKKKPLEDEVKAKEAVWNKARLEVVRTELLMIKTEVSRERELGKGSPGVYTFDLILLQKVGKAAQQYLHDPSVLPDVSSLAKAREDVAKAKSLQKELVELAKKDKASAPALRKMSGEAGSAVAAAEAKVKTVSAGVAERLKQPFFQPWFQSMMFWFLFVGFAIKVPVFPFHTWLPDAHVEAPTPISMLLAGVLLKLGGYGIIRIAYPICPWAAEHFAWWVALLGIINIVYGALAAMAQTDFKKLVAYSSISHMGYVILGVAVWTMPERSQFWSWGMNGAMYQMIGHGITSAGMFFCVGVIYDRAHHRNLDNFRGLYEPMPLYGGISAVIFFAAMGLPGMCGFVGEFMVVLATWNYDKTFAILAAATVVLTAAYILWTLQRVFMGTNPAYKNYSDITPRELTAIVPLVILAILFGVAPTLILNWMEPSVTNLVDVLASR